MNKLTALMPNLRLFLQRFISSPLVDFGRALGGVGAQHKQKLRAGQGNRIFLYFSLVRGVCFCYESCACSDESSMEFNREKKECNGFLG
jgi:hypothetical protein